MKRAWMGRVLMLFAAGGAAGAARPSRAPVTVCQPVPEGTILCAPAPAPEGDQVMWYRQPARRWVEALPIGNGSFGGMEFGGVTHDVLPFNHDTIWTRPRMPEGRTYADRLPDRTQEIRQARQLIFEGKRVEADRLLTEQVMLKGCQWGAYQPFATLEADYALDVSGGVEGYRHDLDLATGIARTRFRVAGTEYVRETWVADGASVILLHMTAQGVGKITGSFTLSRTERERSRSVGADGIMLAGQAGDEKTAGVRFASKVRALAGDGTVVSENGVLRVRNATELTLLISGATDYNAADPYTPLPEALEERCATVLRTIEKQGVKACRDAAAAAHQALFGRVSLRLGDRVANALPTGERVAAVHTGAKDPSLAALVYQYGRYLLICSSRPGSLPANLQGLWNDRTTPPWYSDYHYDINIQMNYWMAESTHLSECHQPYFALLERMMPGGTRVASEMFGCRGFLIPHATGGYGTAIPVGQAPYALWTMGGAWAARQVMDAYRFTGDTAFLREHGFPVLRGAVLFCLDWLTEDPKTGLLVAGPDVSPENFYLLENGDKAGCDMGCAMDQQVVWQAFTDFLEAVEVLGVSDPVAAEVRRALAKLAPSVRIGADGRVMEWSQPFGEKVPGHRHLSPLYAFYPGNQYAASVDAEQVAAAKKSLEVRIAGPGDAGKSGWSAAWVACLYARFGRGDRSEQVLASLMENNLFPNLFAVYPPDLFQIDGNFGFTGALTELLLQSHAGEIVLLPALPSSWSDGAVSGLVARGGFDVSMEWKNGRLVGGALVSRLGQVCRVRYGDRSVTLRIGRGERVDLAAVGGLLEK